MALQAQVPAVPQRTQGMDPTQELQQWAQWRQQVDAAGGAKSLTGDAARYYNGPNPRPGDPKFAQTYGTDLFSPEAGTVYVNAKTHFDAKTGKVEKNKSGWDLPETKLIAAVAAGMAGAIAGPAIMASLGSGGAPGGAVAGGTSSGAGLTGGVTGATTAAEAAAAEAAVPGLASTTIGTGMMGPIAGGVSGAGMGGASTVGGSVLGGLVGKTTLGKVGDLLNVGAGGMGSAADMMAKNRSVGGELGLGAEEAYTRQVNANTAAQQAYENELLGRAKEESSQRNDALKNVYRESYTQNAKPGPFNVAGLAANSPAYMEALHNLSTQGSGKLAKGPAYDTDTYGALTSTQIAPDQMFDRQKFMDKYGNPSTMEKVLGYGSAGAGTLGKVINIFKPRS